MSLSRNSPVKDSAGNPPPAGSLYPGGGGRRKLISATQQEDRKQASADPTSVGATGLMASRIGGGEFDHAQQTGERVHGQEVRRGRP